MKRAAIVVAVLGMCAWSFGQSNAKPAAGQATPAGQATTPPGKRPPAAKTQPEFEAYKAAITQTDPVALEKAVDDFAAKYPDSELRAPLYTVCMGRYQGNPDKMMETGKKILAIDPDDPAALVGVAQAIVEKMHDTDLDKDQERADAKKNAERALVTVDTDVPTSGYSVEQITAFKNGVRSEAYFIMGTLSFKDSKWADAEVNLRKSVDLMPQSPDAFTIFQLAVSLDMQNKLPEAMKYADQAVDLTKDRADSGVGKAARAEKDRLTKLSSGTAPGQAATPPKN